MLQTEIETRVTLRLSDIIFQIIVILSVSVGIFTYIFYIYVIDYLECSINEKSYCIQAYVAAWKFPH